jgi:hypothetical protein
VTNVTTIDELGDFANFTTVAQSQGFHPKYDLADDGLLQIGGGTEAPNSANIAGAIAITSGREGEQNTPGLTPSPGSVKCNAIAQAAGQPPTWQASAGGLGVACDQLWMFEDAVDHAPALAQDALAAGLDSTGPVDLSFPYGPADFTGQGVTTGGEYWRTDQFSSACNCWQVIDPNFQPSF